MKAVEIRVWVAVGAEPEATDTAVTVTAQVAVTAALDNAGRLLRLYDCAVLDITGGRIEER